MVQTDVTDINWWADIVVGLLDRGEWKTLIFGLILTFAATYILRTVYKSVVNRPKQNPNHVRLVSIVAGFIAAFAVWDNNTISMNWWQAGIMLGPLSIALYHILMGIVANPPVNRFLPWLYPLLKGIKDPRRTKR